MSAQPEAIKLNTFSLDFLKAYVVTMRPYLMFVSGTTGLVAIAFTPRLSVTNFILRFAASFLSYGFGQALTDCFQIDTDSLSSPYRPLTQGLISRLQTFIVSALGLSFCIGVFAAGNLSNLLLGAAAGSGLATYTFFKRRWWGGPFYNVVGVEGVYSMDGDLAPLDVIVPLCKAHNAILLVDDAHGTGVMGSHGRGTAEHFGIEGQVDVTMGTFSKTFSATGGFIAASKPIINYLRFFARSYMFSASLPPTVIATVLAGLDVMEQEPERLTQLWDNVAYVHEGLTNLGFPLKSESPIFPLIVPVGMDLREAAHRFHDAGVFVNSIEYPAVPISQQRFRVSLMATHTKRDLDRLLEVVEDIWSSLAPRVTTNDSKVRCEAA